MIVLKIVTFCVSYVFKVGTNIAVSIAIPPLHRRKYMKPQLLSPHLAQKLVRMGNTTMLLSVFGLITSIIVSYPLEHMLPLPTLVIGHIATLVFATAVKLGYIARCTGLNELGADQL